MSDDACDTATIEREDPEVPGGEDIFVASPDDGVLVEYATEKHGLDEITEREDVDVHTAITGGLAGYLLGLDGQISGRSTRLVSVVSDWADAAEGSHPMPSAAVHSEEDGRYSTTSGLGATRPQRLKGSPDGAPVAVTQSAVYELSRLVVEVSCPDKVLRSGVRRMLENAFWPVEWMAGFRLVLPRYHGAVCEYLVTSAQFGDSEDLARQGRRPIAFTLRARCPVYRLRRLPLARPIVSGTITAGS